MAKKSKAPSAERGPAKSTKEQKAQERPARSAKSGSRKGGRKGK